MGSTSSQPIIVEQQQERDASRDGIEPNEVSNANMQIIVTEPSMERGERIACSEEEYDEKLTHTPSIKELEDHMDSMRDVWRAKYARGILVFTNIVSLIFACVLIYYGASNDTRKQISTTKEAFQTISDELLALGEHTINVTETYVGGLVDPHHGYVQNILRPYQMVLALGTSLLLMSVMGLLGAACPTKRVGKEMLFGYFSTLLVFICVLMWGAVMCFQYQNETKRFLDYTVESNWQTLRPLVHTGKKNVYDYIEDNSNLILSGAFCIVSAIVMTIGLWASSKTMGHYFTVKKVLVSCSISGIFSGLVLVSLSIYYGAKNIGGQWAPGVTAVAGVAILLLSMLGIYGVKAESLLALVLHLFLMCGLSLFVSVMGVLVIAYPHVVSDFVHQNWKAIRENVTDGSEKHFRSEIADNLLLLGSASLLFGVLLILSAAASFAACLETYRLKKSAVLRKIEIRNL